MRPANFLSRHLDVSPLAYQSEADRDDAADLNASRELPFGVDAYYNDHTLSTKDGAKIQIIRVQGLYSEMLDNQGVDAYKYQRNTALESIADSNVGIYVYDVRRASNRWPGGTYRNWFANYVYSRMKERFEKGALYQHEIYIAVVRYRHYSGMVGKLDSFSGCLISPALIASWSRRPGRCGIWNRRSIR